MSILHRSRFIFVFLFQCHLPQVTSCSEQKSMEEQHLSKLQQSGLFYCFVLTKSKSYGESSEAERADQKDTSICFNYWNSGKSTVLGQNNGQFCFLFEDISEQRLKHFKIQCSTCKSNPFDDTTLKKSLMTVSSTTTLHGVMK